MILQSAQNSRIKLVNRLRSKRGREQEARFVIDYERDFRRALAAGFQVDFVLHCPELGAVDASVESETYRVTPELMARVSYRENPGSLVAVMRSRAPRRLAEIQAAAKGNALVLVDLRVPGNIGALLRTADAAGMDAVVLVDSASDLYNPNIIRSSTGACFRDNIYQLESEEAISYFRRIGMQIVCADVKGAASLYELAFRHKSAIVLGAEDRGLSEAWLDTADAVARIPMASRLSDSLNVSVSGAILMYELFRQRQASVDRAER